MENVLELFDLLDNDDEDELRFGLPRHVFARSNCFSLLDDVNFQRRFRLIKEVVVFVFGLIENDLEYPTDLYE